MIFYIWLVTSLGVVSCSIFNHLFCILIFDRAKPHPCQYGMWHRELGDPSNKIQQHHWLSGEVHVLSSDEIDIVGWKVSDSCYAVADHLIQLSPAESCKESMQTEGVAREKGRKYKIFVCIVWFLWLLANYYKIGTWAGAILPASRNGREYSFVRGQSPPVI